jgi:hypothetical protein
MKEARVKRSPVAPVPVPLWLQAFCVAILIRQWRLRREAVVSPLPGSVAMPRFF